MSHKLKTKIYTFVGRTQKVFSMAPTCFSPAQPLLRSER